MREELLELLNLLRRYRIQKGMTLKEAAERTRLSEQALTEIEDGISVAGGYQVAKLSRLYRLPAEERSKALAISKKYWAGPPADIIEKVSEGPDHRRSGSHASWAAQELNERSSKLVRPYASQAGEDLSSRRLRGQAFIDSILEPDDPPATGATSYLRAKNFLASGSHVPTQEATDGMVFLCHSSGDKEQVRQLYRKLQTAGVRCWFDEEELLPGQDWDYEISKAIRASKYVLVCLSQSSITRTGYVQKELRKALDVADEQPEGSTFIIPARLEDCELPERLRRWQAVDLFRGQVTSACSRF
jgi:transcriptional regulator with XRE-family HTH domain